MSFLATLDWAFFFRGCFSSCSRCLLFYAAIRNNEFIKIFAFPFIALYLFPTMNRNLMIARRLTGARRYITLGG